MNIYITKNCKKIIGDNKIFLDEILRKIPAFIKNDYFRIKPIHKNNTKYSLFELKIHAKIDYRVAFAKIENDIIVCFASKNLIKEEFEKEFLKFISKNENFLDEMEILGKNL